MVKRIRAASVLGERALEACKRALEVAARRKQEPATPREDRKRPGPVERVGALLPGRENLVGLVELADGDQSLQEIAELQALRRLEHEIVASFVRTSQVHQRRVRVSERELDKPEHPAMTR